MKKERWLVFGLLGLVLAFGLTGCIISASPNPGTIIEMKPGDKVLFKVVGPVNTPTTRCLWTITRKNLDIYNFDLEDSYEIVSEGKNEFELVFNQDSKLSNKKNTITCAYQSFQLIIDPGIPYGFYFGWATTDSREWEVRTNPNSTSVITGDYIIENDSDLQLLKGYTTITGSLIVGPDIESLEGLENLTTIGGDLGICRNKYIKDLTAFESLTSIGSLHICYDDALTSLDGLDRITSVKGDLYISDNAALTDISSLGNMTSLGGALIIVNNSVLTNLSGLENITSVGGALNVSVNAALTNLSGLGNITSVGGWLNINDNAALTNLSGLENITSVGGDLVIYYNADLTSLSGLEGLTSVGGNVEIGRYFSGNPVLTSISGLKNLTSIGGGLRIESNGALTSLSGLENLTSVSDLLIEKNEALTSLSGLKNLTSVVTDLYVDDNAALTSLGMTGLQKVGDYFGINSNPLLCTSLAYQLRNQVLAGGGIGGNVDIEGNKNC